MADDQLAVVDGAIHQVLDIRIGVQQLFDSLSQPLTAENRQQLAATVQDVARNVSAFAASWEGPLAPIIQALEGSISLGVKPEQGDGSAGNAMVIDGAMGGTDAAPQRTGTAGSSTKRIAQELDAALFDELALPALWEHSIRAKRVRGAAAGAGSAAAPGASGAATPASAYELGEVLERVRAACPGMQLHGVSLMGAMSKVANEDIAEVRLLYPRVFCASVVLEGPGRPTPVRVVTDAAEHASDLDPWSPSASHNVFRRVSALATRALAFFLRRSHAVAQLQPSPAEAHAEAQGAASDSAQGAASPGAIALEDLLLWLASYRDMFRRPCAISGKVLALEPASMHPLPPIFRPYMVPRQVLLDRATRADAVVAYHMHVAPQELLGWDDDMPPTNVQAQLCAA